VHTEVGHRCVGAKVNGRIVPLDYRLKNGDIVEVILGKQDAPSLDWLNFVKTAGARNKLKSWFKRRRGEENVKRGEATIRAELTKMMLNPEEALCKEKLEVVAKEFGFGEVKEFFAAVGYGEYSPYAVARKLREQLKKQHALPPAEEEIIRPLLKKTSRQKKRQGIKVAQLENVQVNVSRCCKPLPGDNIVGYVTRGRGVSVHRADCPNVVDLPVDVKRLVEVSWNDAAEIFYPVDIEVEAFDRVGVLKDILEKVSSQKTNVAAANVRTKRGSSAIIKMVVDIKNIEHLSQVLAAIREVADVYDVYRADVSRQRKPVK
jgi:GTP pyrophosphokinase